MEDFRVKPETGKRPEGRRKAVLSVVLGLTAAAGLASSVSCGLWITAGIPTTTSGTYGLTKTEVSGIIDEMVSERLGWTMQHDVLLVLTDGTNAAVFRADGYDASHKFAYECRDFSDYESQPANEMLSFDEWNTFTCNDFNNYQDTFGDYTILVIYNAFDRESVEYEAGFVLDHLAGESTNP